MIRPYAVLALALLYLGACAAIDPESVSDSRGMTVGAGTPVLATYETPPLGGQGRDAADDPAIWVDPADRSRGVIIGTEKKLGLSVYDLKGRELQALPGGAPNNVDLREGFLTPAGPRVLVAASDRQKMGAALWLLDPATLKLEPWGTIPLDLAEPYGLCLGMRGPTFVLIVNGTDGQVRQLAVSAGADGKPQAVEERRFSVPTQPEGCVVDDRRGRLYLGEENVGIWRFDVGTGPAKGEIIARAPSPALVPDVEGLALLEDGQAAWLIASSQGDSAFAVWRVDGDEPVYRGRFSVVDGNGIDAVTGTDGVAAQGGVVGDFAEGLVVMQDDEDGGSGGGRQNFKLVGWSEIRRALGL